jgi:O-acetyl-ADP-ribose deacetylase (regulator of RNase III)
MDIQLLRADLASMKVDALVFPRDPKTRDPEDRSAVVMGGNVLARFIIEIGVPMADERGADEKLHDATLAALDRAEELAVASVGLPAIGSDPFGFALDRSARTMLTATIAYRARARSLQRTVFFLFSKEELTIFTRILEELEA